MTLCQFFTQGKNSLTNQRSFTMWKALRTILSTLSVQKFTGPNRRFDPDYAALFLRMEKIPLRIKGFTDSHPPC
jgi:hypothetical protein